jgi:imidazolonepropionase-like amidohydrolase
MTGHRGTVLAASRIVTGKVVHTPGWVTIDRDRIMAVGAGRPPHVDRDLGAAIVVPGFIDLHVHGGAGGSFTGATLQSALHAVYAHREHETLLEHAIGGRFASWAEPDRKLIASVAERLAGQVAGD